MCKYRSLVTRTRSTSGRVVDQPCTVPFHSLLCECSELSEPNGSGDSFSSETCPEPSAFDLNLPGECLELSGYPFSSPTYLERSEDVSETRSKSTIHQNSSGPASKLPSKSLNTYQTSLNSISSIFLSNPSPSNNSQSSGHCRRASTSKVPLFWLTFIALLLVPLVASVKVQSVEEPLNGKFEDRLPESQSEKAERRPEVKGK
jgi:hypothetical protein